MTRLAGPLGKFVTFDKTGKYDPGHMTVTSGDRTLTARGVHGGLLLRRAIWTGEDGPVAANHKEPAAARLREWTAAALDPGGELLKAAHGRREASVNRLRAHGRLVRELRVRPQWRLTVGLGEETPMETGMSVHGTYGVPILPGSALKGAARAYARDSGDPDYDTYGVFGREPGAPTSPPTNANVIEDGRFVFLDGLPLVDPQAGSSAAVQLDVMNPHVPDYYASGGVVAPAEYLQPIPVTFLTVSSAVEFTVHLVGRGGDKDLPDLGADKIIEWLTGALIENGIGAKTNAGYGYCTVTVAEDPA